MAHQGKSSTILMADDDADDCLLVKEAFRENQLLNDIRFVKDGEELMSYLHRRGAYADCAHSPRPAIILLDLNMPRKDGREALREIKSDPFLKTIPVVILTTSKEQEDIHLCYESGASSFITKPVSFEELLEVVQLIEKYWFSIVELPPEQDSAPTAMAITNVEAGKSEA